MRQICLIVFLLLTTLFLNACKDTEDPLQPTLTENQTTPPDIIGYITKIENQRALVVSPNSREINQTRKEFYDAIWVSNMPPDIGVGQNVHVWLNGGIAFSYPGQGSASKVTISKIHKPKKATLTQEEVIRRALINNNISKYRHLCYQRSDL